MEIFSSPREMTAWADAVRAGGETIALVPTMGYFHEGHLALMRHGKAHADHVVVSLFVNPIQFGPGEDLERYPSNFDNDCKLARKQGVGVLFAPRRDEMYPDGFATSVTVKGLTETLCGLTRPGHFDGVTTVVAKLFHIVQPHVAVFGEKDLQQLAVIRRMVKDLDWNIGILAHPIVREEDGLAMSSRNSYLSQAERKTARSLYKALTLASDLALQGSDCAGIGEELHCFFRTIDGLEVEYARFVDGDTLEEVEAVDSRTVLALAARVGETRLIDNSRLLPEPGSANVT